MNSKSNNNTHRSKLLIAIVLLILALLSSGMILHSRSTQIETQKKKLDKLSDEVWQRNKEIERLNEKLNNLSNQNNELKERLTELKERMEFKHISGLPVDNSASGLQMNVVVTAYDLSVQSCGKPIGHPGYGMTASGVSLEGHSRESARAIAVDPDMIPLGSEVSIEFHDPSVSHYSGIYRAVDTGGDIGGNRIDLFMGDFQQYEPSDEAIEFGVRSATITVL